MNKIKSLLYILPLLLFAQCTETEPSQTKSTKEETRKETKRLDFTYTAVSKDSVKALKDYPASQQAVLMAVNRVDMSNIDNLDTVLVPDNLNAEVWQYLPFPEHVPYLKDVDKIVLFSYPAQVFAAYENGWLKHTGPTNMGRENNKTPTGLYFANWKAEQTTSTFDDEWELKWNFNIENKEGIGWHQYALPGYPASHSCLRMLESDAKAMYDWADEWVLEGTDNVKAKGTPVIVFGSYPFGGSKPWWQLLNNPKALDISADDIKAVVAPHLNEILQEQKNSKAIDTSTN